MEIEQPEGKEPVQLPSEEVPVMHTQIDPEEGKDSSSEGQAGQGSPAIAQQGQRLRGGDPLQSTAGAAEGNP